MVMKSLLNFPNAVFDVVQNVNAPLEIDRTAPVVKISRRPELLPVEEAARAREGSTCGAPDDFRPAGKFVSAHKNRPRLVHWTETDTVFSEVGGPPSPV